MASSATFTIKVGSGSHAAGAADASGGDVIECKLASVTDVQPGRIQWDIFGTHGAAAPSLSLGGSPLGQTCTFTLPAGDSQAYGIRCRVNGGEFLTGRGDDTSKSAVYVANPNGQRPFFINETFEGDSDFGTVPRLNEALSGGNAPERSGGSISTASATPVTLATVAIPSGDVRLISVACRGRNQTTGDSFAIHIASTFESTGGTVLEILPDDMTDPPNYKAREDTDIDVELTIDGTNVLVSFTGHASNSVTGRWYVEVM
jgi:hypothetical protein